MKKIVFFNPRSGKYNHRVPLSILQIAASIQNKFEYAIVDGNMEEDPYTRIRELFNSGEYGYFASTVMPGPQTKQAIPITKKIKDEYPDITTIWGGYFASNQSRVSVDSGFVDYVVAGPGDYSFPKLLEALENKKDDLKEIENLVYKNGEIIYTRKSEIPEQDNLPPLPFDTLNKFYPIEKYLGKTFLGSRTFAYHSSMGCPFTCAFCGIVPIFNARWKAKSAEKVYRDILFLKENYGINGIEFFDNNFLLPKKG